MNIENFKAVIAKIKEDPKCWDQRNWHCGTTYCFFGLAQILAGHKENLTTVREDAMTFLGLSSKAERWYFSSPRRTLEDFENAIG